MCGNLCSDAIHVHTNHSINIFNNTSITVIIFYLITLINVLLYVLDVKYRVSQQKCSL